MDRYSVLKSGEQKEWLAGCPVRVEKYNILMDNQTGRNVLQIKYTALGEKRIKTVWADIHCYDDAHDHITTVEDVVYTNISARRGEFFGDRQPVPVDSNAVGNIKAVIKKVAFDDESVWRNDSGEIGVILPEQPKAKEYYGELYRQYYIEARNIKVGTDKVLTGNNDFWQCTCGQANSISDENCIFCGAKLEELAKISDVNYLTEQNNIRLEKEKAEEERRERVRAENARKVAEEAEKARIAAIEEEERMKAAKEKKTMQRKKALLALCAVCVLAFAVYNVSRLVKYNSAVKAVENGDYDNAIAAFTELGSFMHSEDKLTEANKLKQDKLNSEAYLKAETLMTSKDLTELKEAAHIYQDLGEYKDSSEKLTETYYNLAVIEYNSGDYSNATVHYGLCGNYSNSAAMKTSANRQYTLQQAITNYNAGNYAEAINKAGTIRSIKNANPNGASAEQILNWSLQKAYEGATSGKLAQKDTVSLLEVAAKYNYKDSSSRLYNIKYKYQRISGTYKNSGNDWKTYIVNADYRNNVINVTLNWFDSTYKYSGQLLSTGGSLGSIKEYDFSDDYIKFYPGYLIDDYGDRYNKVS